MDFYHLQRENQPFIMDYIHRLCKDLPLYFKVATLRHASVLYAERGGQPVGAQERHDYQPINIDFTFQEFKKTEKQNFRYFSASLPNPQESLRWSLMNCSREMDFVDWCLQVVGFRVIVYPYS